MRLYTYTYATDYPVEVRVYRTSRAMSAAVLKRHGDGGRIADMAKRDELDGLHVEDRGGSVIYLHADSNLFEFAAHELWHCTRAIMQRKYRRVREREEIEASILGELCGNLLLRIAEDLR